MASPTILSIDQGTTSSRAMLFSKGGDVVGVKQRELKLFTPRNGWVEQNPEDIWNDTLWCMQQIIRDYPEEAQSIAGIGITNQRETTVLWDRRNGRSVYNAIVWQDRRGAPLCERLKNEGHESLITERTGLLLDPYFSATKIAWILDNVEGARESAAAGNLAFGTIETFLLWRLTGGRCHVSDATNASRTMLYNIIDGRWDDDLLRLFDIPASILPTVEDNVFAFGKTDASLLGKSYMVGGMAGDQQAALVGQACFEPGMVKSTYGTGCFALMNIGNDFVQSKNRLLTTIGYRLDGRTTYALEGAIFVAGAAIQWLRDNMKFFADAGESEGLATSVADTDGVYFVPAFTGLGAPYWNPDARGLISGLSRGTSMAHITRAALEAQGFQTLDLMAAFAADSLSDPAIIRADGGLVSNQFVCQFLSDMLQKPVEIPRVTETTALGAAYLAGLQAGVYAGLEDVTANWQAARHYKPAMTLSARDRLYEGWRRSIGHLTDKRL